MMRLGGVLFVLLAGCHYQAVPVGMLQAPDFPDRLYCAAHDAGGRCTIYRSAQPTLAQFVAMRDRLGLVGDVKLNPASEAREQVPPGITLYEHPMSSVLRPDEEEVEATCVDIERAPKPILIHCTAGRERTGWAIERCVRMRQTPAPSAAAMYEEWVAYGMRTLLAPGLIEDFEHANPGWRR